MQISELHDRRPGRSGLEPARQDKLQRAPNHFANEETNRAEVKRYANSHFHSLHRQFYGSAPIEAFHSADSICGSWPHMEPRDGRRGVRPR
jgi:hypothetical protein